MDSSDWNIVSAIGTVFAAAATSAAVIVALWQTKWSNRKKLKLSFGDSYFTLNSLGKKSEPYICLSVTNTGNRKVIIDKWGFILNNKNAIFTTATFDLHQPFTPFDLDIEKQLSLFYPRNRFIAYFKKDKLIFGNGKIKFYICDSTGKMYIILSSKTVDEYCNL